jgi:hypothetical protein
MRMARGIRIPIAISIPTTVTSTGERVEFGPQWLLIATRAAAIKTFAIDPSRQNCVAISRIVDKNH